MHQVRNSIEIHCYHIFSYFTIFSRRGRECQLEVGGGGTGVGGGGRGMPTYYLTKFC